VSLSPLSFSVQRIKKNGEWFFFMIRSIGSIDSDPSPSRARPTYGRSNPATASSPEIPSARKLLLIFQLHFSRYICLESFQSALLNLLECFISRRVHYDFFFLVIKPSSAKPRLYDLCLRFDHARAFKIGAEPPENRRCPRRYNFHLVPIVLLVRVLVSLHKPNNDFLDVVF